MQLSKKVFILQIDESRFRLKKSYTFNIHEHKNEVYNE